MLSPSSKLPLQPYPHHCARHQDFCHCSAAAVPPPPLPHATSLQYRCRGLFFPELLRRGGPPPLEIFPIPLFPAPTDSGDTPSPSGPPVSPAYSDLWWPPPQAEAAPPCSPKLKLRCPCSPPDRFCTVASCSTGQNSSTCKLLFFPQRRCLPVALLLAS
ncbi:hypothetical protein PAHAL_J060000 [Panicum hallii]|uniref:Uncharacterized protein n=1 Tax=Panicum hallii TaxID=206008 RepID=A0A2T7A9Y8_9POAL|nr:hypothetical protein PAHAL_J060000 [Panicum hallii]